MRARSGVARHRSKKRKLKEARGNVGARSKLIRTVKETLLRAHVFAFRGRKEKKRDYRALWIVRISAACRELGTSYSNFINGLHKAGVAVNRKLMAELALNTPSVFQELVGISQAALKPA